MMEKLINIKTAAEMLGVCQDTLRKWDKDKQLVAVRSFGGHRRYLLSDIEKLQRKGEEDGRE